MLYRRFYICADTSTIRTLCLTLVRPHLEYVSQVWDSHLVKDCKQLEDIQKFVRKVSLIVIGSEKGVISRKTLNFDIFQVATTQRFLVYRHPSPSTKEIKR